MIYTTISKELENVVFMDNPFKPLFASEDKNEVIKRNNKLADFIEQNCNLFPFCTLCNLNSIEDLRKSPYDGNLSIIGFGTSTILWENLVFLHVGYIRHIFLKTQKKLKALTNFLTQQNNK